MRIISGKYKGKRLAAPKRLPVRPTTDRAKEGLFNILNNRYDFEELSVLDLFSGTGNISYEFASRGSNDIAAVDINPGCIKYISKTVKELDVPITTIKSDVFYFLGRCNAKYDIIFADPPYDFDKDNFLKIPDLVFNHELLRDNGLLIVEHSPHTHLEKHNRFSNSRKYGSSIFSFFEN